MSVVHLNPVPEQDPAILDRLQQPPSPPERIRHWMNSQLSVARFYGGCNFQGVRYVINYGEPGNPLVRWDVLQAEQKAKQLADKAAAKAARKKRPQWKQKGLL